MALHLVKPKPPEADDLTRGTALAMALRTCVRCHGTGLLEEVRLCGCSARRLFRETLQRVLQFSRCPSLRVSISRNRNSGCLTAGYPRLEFCADFLLLARRVLPGLLFRLMTLHHLRGFDWRVCGARLRLNRGEVFHAIYRLEAAVGRALVGSGLFPSREYFEPQLHVASLLDMSHGPGKRRNVSGGSWSPVHYKGLLAA